MMTSNSANIKEQVIPGDVMKRGAVHVWTLLVLLVPAEFAISQPAGVAWPEAVARLAGERAKAETCVALLKGHGDQAQISRGQLVYVTAKADTDAVIAGLVIALAQDATPENLPSLEGKLARGASGLWEFCKTVNDLLPSTAGQKNVFVDIAKATIEPLVKSLIEGITALYNNHRKDDALTRLTIQTQLEAAKWPDFGKVQAAQ